MRPIIAAAASLLAVGSAVALAAYYLRKPPASTRRHLASPPPPPSSHGSDFSRAVERARDEVMPRLLTSSAHQDAVLHLYGLYKQTTCGRMPSSSSSAPWDPTKRAKYFAWKQYEHLSTEQAASQYVDLVAALRVVLGGEESTPQKPSSSGGVGGPRVSTMKPMEEEDEGAEPLNRPAGLEAYDAVLNADFGTLDDDLIAQHPALLRQTDEDQRTLLHWAVDRECHSAVVFFVSKLPEVDVNARDSDGFTPLAYACMGGMRDIAHTLLVDGGASALRCGYLEDDSASALWPRRRSPSFHALLLKKEEEEEGE